MPVVFRSEGYRFFFYSNEGDPREPVHVHVRKAGATAKFWVAPVGLDSSDGFDARSLRDVERIIEENAALIERAWNEYFG
jgi:hypothetical protein